MSANNVISESEQIRTLIEECEEIIRQNIALNFESDVTYLSDEFNLEDEIDEVMDSREENLNNEIEEYEYHGDDLFITEPEVHEIDADVIFVGETVFPLIDLCSPVPSSNQHITRNLTGQSQVNQKEKSNRKRKLDDEMSISVNPSSNEVTMKVDCAICLSCPLNRTPTATMCGHIFCQVCITKAFEKKKICPLCKTPSRNLVKLYGISV